MSSSSSSSPSPEPPTPVKTKRKRKDTAPPPVVDSDPDSSDSEDEAVATPDEPVLSHAERRRQKRAAKLKAKKDAVEDADVEGEGSSKKKRKLENGTAVPVPAAQRKNSVWVGNMSFKTTQENLRTFFKDVGEVVRIYMPTKPAANPAMKPENRGFAYVDFATPEAKFVAISLSEQPLIGRKLLIKDGDDFTGRPAAPGAEAASVTHSKTAQKILRAQKQPPAPTLFLGNLGFETTENDIRQLFEAHRPKPKKPKKEENDASSDEEEDKKAREKEKEREKPKEPKDVWLRKVRMGTFEDSGACKGFAFVDFTSIEHATASLINPKNHQLNGRKLVVEYAGADAVRRGAPKAKREEGAAPPKRHEGLSHGKRPERPERPERKPRQDWSTEKAEHGVEPASAINEGVTPREERVVGGEEPRRHKGPKSRPKPGAALALAKRESAAILPSKGQKITF
ncbi:hypothetical protein H0H81_005862 [Sphagnurus paluster]|uniref:RRM domain-containing protein n=1 Tax=Sphagnurus paluster TaxID=117069 RepID=A0A9P7FYU9_9AGAR|nr:hypothetical protein H0H81_005862 [Sphagnurus paluster]